MSHIVTIETRVHDPVALAAACERLKLAAPVQGTTPLFSGEASGWIVKLPEWQYPVVIDTLSGVVRYDNYNGAWGSDGELHKLIQAYSIEKVKIESRKRGYTVSEQELQDGSVKVQLIEAA